jgi:diguanylate cyclase (GGDEF)-like protein
MVHRSRSAAVLAASLAALFLPCVAVGADSPLPVQTPDLPGSPSVGVTPGESGVGVDAGAGDTAVHVGAGTNGVSVGVSGRPSSGTQPGSNDSAPVTGPIRTPVRRPATPDSRSASATGGTSPTIFGPKDTASGSGAGRGASKASRAFSPRGQAALHRAASPTSVEKSKAAVPPFFELVERLPAAVLAGVVALGLLAFALWFAWIRNRRRLAGNAFVDPVTGIANAAAFTRLLDRELGRARRYKRPLGVLLLEVSDAEREGGGLLRLRDNRIREVTAAISFRVREADTVARLAGDRFGVVCPEATEGATETLARAFERRLEELRIRVKVGVAEREATDRGAADLIIRAAAALQEAKENREQTPRTRHLRAA